MFCALSLWAQAPIANNQIVVIPKTDLSATGELHFRDRQSTPHYIGFKAPTTADASNPVWILPAVDAIGCLQSDGSLNLSLGSCSGGSSLPVSDSTSIVKDDADATKLLRFEIGGFTTATTRVLTPQNANYIVAGTNLDNAWSASQSATGTVDWGDAITPFNSFAAVHHKTTFVNSVCLDMTLGLVDMGVATANGCGSLQLHGNNSNTASSGDGRIILTPGNVSRGFNTQWSSVYTQAQVSNQIAFIIQDSSTPNTTSLFLIEDNAGTAKFSIQGGGTANPWTVTTSGHFLPSSDITYDLGSASLRFRKAWLKDLDISGTCTGCPGSGPPFSDALSIIENSVDNTKLVKFNAASIATGTTRTLTVQNSSYTLAGKDIDNTWTQNQTPNATNTYTLGDTSHRWNKVWANNLDVSGTDTFQGWTINGSTGELGPQTDAGVSIGDSTHRVNQVWAYSHVAEDFGHTNVVYYKQDSPQIDASSLPGNYPFQIHGSNSGNGQIVLTPGAVFGANNSSVFTQAQVSGQYAFVVQDSSSASNSCLLCVLDNFGTTIKWAVQGGNGGSGGWVMNISGHIYPNSDNVNDLGASFIRFHDFYLNGYIVDSNTTTGGGDAVFGNNNCPAVDCNTVYKWMRFKDGSGTVMYVPAWR